MERNSQENKNAKHKLDVLYKIWLGRQSIFQTFEYDEKCDIEEIQALLDEDDSDEAKSQSYSYSSCNPKGAL